MTLLEVIVLDAVDARAAERGGAGRLELVTDMAADGLTPSMATVRSVLAATSLPVRVMVRTENSFVATDVDELRRTAGMLRDTGANEFVLGFLDRRGDVDLDACRKVAAELSGCPWTFHRAVDHAAGRAAAHGALAKLLADGCDTVLSAGGPNGVGEGLSFVEELRPRRGEGPRLLVGGGLRRDHLPRLRAAGVDAFHVGGAVRPDGWSGPVSAAAVTDWVSTLHTV